MFAALASASPLPAPAFAILEGIGPMEMMLVAFVGLLLFGGKGLPDMARTLGRVIREFKKATQGVEDEVRRVMDEDSATPPRPRAKPRPLPAPAPLPPAGTETAPPGTPSPPSTPPPPPSSGV